MDGIEQRHGRLPAHTREIVSFVDYLRAHPDLRFWQALREWSGYKSIVVTTVPYIDPEGMTFRDTYHWEGRRHDEAAADAPVGYHALTVAELRLLETVAYPHRITNLPKWVVNVMLSLTGALRVSQASERQAHSLLNSGRSWHVIQCPENAQKAYHLWFLDNDSPLPACRLNPGDQLVVIRAPRVDMEPTP